MLTASIISSKKEGIGIIKKITAASKYAATARSVFFTAKLICIPPFYSYVKHYKLGLNFLISARIVATASYISGGIS